MAATSSVSQIHPKFPSSHSRILAISPKVPVTPAFLSPNFRLPCFPCQNALTPDTNQWCHLPLVKPLSISFMVLHNSSLALSTLYSFCAHELASSSHIFSRFSMLVFTSGTPLHFLWFRWLLCHCFIMNTSTSRLWRLHNDSSKPDSIIILT